MSKKDNNNQKEQVQEEAPKSASKEIVDSIIVAFVIAIFIRTFFLGVYTIPSGSMLETLQIGDFILVNKLSYKFSKPQHDDIVVFEYPLNPRLDYIKRVIGVPGDVIEIKDKVVYRNGEKLEPDYVQFMREYSLKIADNVPKFTVPEGFYFMMGDNRDNSEDSRFWGYVSEDAIVGKAFIIYWSWGENGPRFSRLFNFKSNSGNRYSNR